MGDEGARFSDAVGARAGDVVERLGALGDVTWKKMFGGAGVFVDGSMFALIDSEARLYLKVDDDNRDLFVAAGGEPHGRMPYYSVPDSVVADESTLLDWARTAADIASR